MKFRFQLSYYKNDTLQWLFHRVVGQISLNHIQDK